MERCEKPAFQLLKMRNIMFTLILVDPEYETSVSIWELKWWSY